MGLKELAYRASRAEPLRAALARLPVRVPFAQPSRRGSGEVVVVVTIDTEGGYVDPGERRIWQGSAPEAFQGYVDGLRNVLDVLARHDARATFFVSPHGLSARGPTLTEVERALLAIPARGHELGLHLHPSSDGAIAARLGRSFDGTAKNVAPADQRRLVATGRDLLHEATRTMPRAFRWGNWALDRASAAIVAEAGFVVDASAVPGLWDVRHPRRPRYDWRATRTHRAFAIADGLLEIPIATFRCAGVGLRADPLYGPLLDGALDAHRACVAPGERFAFVLMTHSTECTMRDGSPTRVLEDLDRFLGRVRALGLPLVTLEHARTFVTV